MSVKIRKQDGTFFTLPNIKGDTGSQGPQGLKGDTGSAGADAKINGVNTLTIEAGENIEITQEGNKIIISATGVVPPTPTEDTYFITSDDENFITSDGENFIVADEAPTEDIKLTTNDNKEFITSNNANFIVKESD